jgi:hypothetical protein
MGLSGRNCPGCGRRVREPCEEAVNGREVCPDCVNALFMGAAAGDVGSGCGVWAMLMRRIRRWAVGGRRGSDAHRQRWVRVAVGQVAMVRRSGW